MLTILETRESDRTPGVTDGVTKSTKEETVRMSLPRRRLGNGFESKLSDFCRPRNEWEVRKLSGVDARACFSTKHRKL